MRLLRVLLFALCPALALAQATFGTITGTVSAPNTVAKIRSIQTRDLAGPRNGLIEARLDF